MKPIEFPEQTTVIAKDHPTYLPLPAHVAADGEVVTCWRLSTWERLKVLWTGRLWLQILTFNNPIQPLNLTADYPFLATTESTEPQPGGKSDE